MTKYLDYSGLEYFASKIKSEISQGGAEPIAGIITPFAGEAAPDGFLLCDGAEYAKADYPELYEAIGIIYGGTEDGDTFNVPNLNGRVPIGTSDTYELGAKGGEETHTLTIDEMPWHTHSQFGNDGLRNSDDGSDWSYQGTTTENTHATSGTGGDQPHNNMQPYLATNYIISTGKVAFASSSSGGGVDESVIERIENLEASQALAVAQVPGVISPYAGQTAPEGFLLCNGAEYAKADYPELFEAIGLTFGGTEEGDTFNVPNLCGRVPIGASEQYAFGSQGGEAEHTLTVDEMPSHSHRDDFTNETSTATDGYSMIGGYTKVASYSSGQLTGGDQPHNNMQPYVATNYIISTGKQKAGSTSGSGSNVVTDESVLQRIEDLETYQASASTLIAGTVIPYAGTTAPTGFLLCDGAEYAKTAYPALFEAIGITYGGTEDGETFNVPDLRGRIPLGTSDAYVLGDTGGEEAHTLTAGELPAHTLIASAHVAGFYENYTNPTLEDNSDFANEVQFTGNVGNQAHNNMQPYVATNYIIATGGDASAPHSEIIEKLTSRIEELEASQVISSPLAAGTVSPYAGSTAPQGFLMCDGSEYAKADYPELYEAIGVTYGGAEDGETFNVPNLNGRVPIGADAEYALGSQGGEAEHVLTDEEMPIHSHTGNNGTNFGVEVSMGFNTGSYDMPSGTAFRYNDSPCAGGDQPHNNMQPYVAMNYIIATGVDAKESVSAAATGLLQKIDELQAQLDAIGLPVSINHGGTAATTAADALVNLGITYGTEAAPTTGTPGSIYIQISEVDA